MNLLDEETHPKLKNDLKRIVDKNKGDDQPWAKMRLLRNKRIAHRDLVTVKSVADPSLVYDHTAAEKALKAVTEFVKAIDNEFAKDQRMYEDPIPASGDASCLIRRLRKAVAYELLEVQDRVLILNGESISTLETMFGLSPLLERNPTSGEQPALDDSTRPG